MPEENKKYYDDNFFKSKHFMKVVIASILVLLIFIVLSMFAKSPEGKAQILTDNLFAVSLLFFIFGAFAWRRSWSLFKKSVKKDDDDFLEQSKKSKYYGKSFVFIGAVNLIGSIVALLIFYQ